MVDDHGSSAMKIIFCTNDAVHKVKCNFWINTFWAQDVANLINQRKRIKKKKIFVDLKNMDCKQKNYLQALSGLPWWSNHFTWEATGGIQSWIF